MPETVSIREDQEIIQVDSFGDVSADDLMQSLEKVLKIHREREYSRVLVDASEETSLPKTVDVFEFASELADTLLTLKFALVTSPQTERDLRFLVNVAINRGAHVKIFDSADDAVDWLIAEPSADNA